MPEQALYLKWRPLSFADVVGQEHITRTLRNSLKTGRIRHAYLFSGPRGTGKTTTARLLAKAVNCTHADPELRPCNACPNCVAVNEGRFLDLIEIDAASHTGVDDVRDLRDRIAFAPGEGQYRVYIIDEVHRFSGSAFDALLKTLEEPPDHALFILATTEIDRVPPTIKSRCLPFEFRRLSLLEVTDRLAHIAATEGLTIERAALELIAREGTGSARDSISLLDQVVADPSEVITLELTQRILGTASVRAVRDLVEALLHHDLAGGLVIINQAIDAGSDPRQFCQQVVDHLRALMLAQAASPDLLEASQEDKQMYQRQAGQISRNGLLRALRLFNDALNQGSSGWQPQLALEIALIESLTEPEAPPAAAAAAVFTAPAAPARPAEAPPRLAPPGTPAVVAAATVREKWPEARALIQQYVHERPEMQTLPDLMQQAHVISVEGNRITMGVKNRLHVEKLNDSGRLRWIERALRRILALEQEIVVRFVQSDGSGEIYQSTPAPDALNDPLIETGSELGAEIHIHDD
ncbi:MAG: DNA polymerase III subunit gamma/tau [Anaerolineae bacterium]|nr:DNA polymerase III subunit gamma/tau [Anaerolineae bacterium]